MSSKKINTKGLVCNFGRHFGQLYTRIPVSYLKWMVNVEHPNANIAGAELERRGTITPTIDISGHAVNRASLKCLDIWKSDMERGEGLHSWLIRVSEEAFSHFDEEDGGTASVKITYKGMKFIFSIEGRWPILKTVMKED